MSSSTTNQIKPRRTIVHYKYRLLLKLGLDPYEAPENVTYNYDTWSEVCQGISTHLGQIIDNTDENSCHCGKWYITNHGRGKIIHIVDFYEYEYDSDTEREIQQDNEKVDSTDEEIKNNIEDNDSDDSDDSEDSSDVEQLHVLLKNNNMSPIKIKESVKNCVDEAISCNIL